MTTRGSFATARAIATAHLKEAPLDLTLQFISWDLEISGSCTFHFVYSVDGFTSFPAYGLVK